MLINISEGSTSVGGVNRVVQEILSRLSSHDDIEKYTVVANQEYYQKYSREHLNGFKSLISFNNNNDLINKIYRVFQQNRKYNRLMKQTRSTIYFAPYSYIPKFNDKRIRTISLIHDLAVFKVPNIYPFYRTFYQKRMYRQIAQRADHFITISEATKRDIMEIFNIPEDKISVIYHGLTTPHDLNEKDEDRVKDKYNLPDKYLLYVGNIQPRKNVRSLVKAFDELNIEYDVPLVLVGRLAWQYESILKEISKAKFKHRIKLLNSVSDLELHYLYKNALIFIYVSLYEGFGLPILEAMGHSVPIITTNYGALSEIGGSAVVKVDPLNISQIKNSMAKVLCDENYRNSLCRKSLERSKMFDWENTVSQYSKVLNGFLELGSNV